MDCMWLVFSLEISHNIYHHTAPYHAAGTLWWHLGLKSFRFLSLSDGFKEYSTVETPSLSPLGQFI